jgi:nitric oxide reductase large subunit
MPSDARPEEARPPHAPDGEPRRWLDDRRNVDKIVYALYAVCAVLLLIDPLVHKHGPFAIEHWWGFYGIYGFVGCVFLVLAAKVLRLIVMRPEDYYDRR